MTPSSQIQRLQLADDLFLPLIEQQILVVGKVFPTAVVGDELSCIGASGELGDKDDQLLTLGEHILTEGENIGQLLSGVGGQRGQRLSPAVEILLQQREGGAVAAL